MKSVCGGGGALCNLAKKLNFSEGGLCLIYFPKVFEQNHEVPLLYRCDAFFPSIANPL
jgi:hypothetical protein